MQKKPMTNKIPRFQVKAEPDPALYDCLTCLTLICLYSS